MVCFYGKTLICSKTSEILPLESTLTQIIYGGKHFVICHPYHRDPVPVRYRTGAQRTRRKIRKLCTLRVSVVKIAPEY